MIGGALSAAARVSENLLAGLPGGRPDFTQSTVLTETALRSWPLPQAPWLMAQTWRDLLFAHWALAPEELRDRVPRGLTLETFEGRSWIGITPFEISGLRPRGLPPLPGLSRFPELNVRTYVSVGGRPGIFFFSLDAASRLAVLAARRAYRLPYFRAEMRIGRQGESVNYVSRRISGGGTPAALEVDYRPTAPARAASPGSLEYFLTERYCLYTVDEKSELLRAEIQHPPWPLQPARASFGENSMTRPWGIDLPSTDPLLHFSRTQQVLIWPLRPVADR